ncbi:putative transposase for IS1667 [Yersinia enterocolitica]|nr:putative transposase for IS1667 [Yersinia enterocolitica]
MKVSTLGIDLAKNVFQLHGVGCNGQTVLKKKLTRDKFLPFLMQLEPCLIGMEACASSHHFARVLRPGYPVLFNRISGVTSTSRCHLFDDGWI